MRDTDRIIENAIKRGAKHKAALLAKAGGTVSADEAANLLGVTVEKLQGEKLLVISKDSGEVEWPAFQLESRAMVAGVKKALAAVQVDEPWAQLNFFFLRLQELDGRTPIQAIREGAVDAVVLAASHFGDHGAS